MEFTFKSIERVPDPNQKLKDLAKAAETSPQDITFDHEPSDAVVEELRKALKPYGRFIVSVVAGGVYVEANPKPKHVRTRKITKADIANVAGVAVVNPKRDRKAVQ